MINESKSFNFIRVLIHLVLKKVNLQISDNCKKTKLFLAKFRLKLSAQTSTSSLNTGLKRQKKFFSLDFHFLFFLVLSRLSILTGVT